MPPAGFAKMALTYWRRADDRLRVDLRICRPAKGRRCDRGLNLLYS